MKNLKLVIFLTSIIALRAQGSAGERFDLLHYVDPKIDANLAAKLLVARNRLEIHDSTCDQPMTLDQAKLYIFGQRKEILRKRHEEESEFGESMDEMYVTKNIIRTKNIEYERPFRKALNDRQYLESVARAYVNEINESCNMCEDEWRIAPKREELLKQIGYRGEPGCRPHPSGSPEIVILYEDHTVQERGAYPTAKRGLLADITKSDPSLMVLSEALSRDAEPVAQARMFDYFKLPISHQLLGENAIPTQNYSNLLGLDADPLIAVRTLQLALDSMEQKYITGSMTGKNITKGNREAFLEFVVKNKNVRELLRKLSQNANGGFLAQAEGEINHNGDVVSSALPQSTYSKIFGESPRLAMDKELTKIWTGSQYSQYRDTIGRLAEAFLESDGAVKNSVNSQTNEPFWRADYQKIVNTALPQFKIDRFDDASFYFMMRTLLYMSMNEVPEITTPETAGGLYRDWAFTENIESAICSARQSNAPVKKIVVSLGRAHATRIADFLRKDGFAKDYNLRFLNADALNEGTVMAAINSDLNHEDNLLSAAGSYKEQCNGYSPPSHLTAGNVPANLSVQSGR